MDQGTCRFLTHAAGERGGALGRGRAAVIETGESCLELESKSGLPFNAGWNQWNSHCLSIDWLLEPGTWLELA